MRLAAAQALAEQPGLQPGDVVSVGRAASVQFAGDRGFNFRVIHVDDRQTYTGWAWLEGYQLNSTGDAVERRSIFVQRAGLRPERPPVPSRGSGPVGQ